MSAKNCILKKAKAGKVDKAKVARLVGLFDSLEAQARGTVGPNEAEALAAKQTEIALARQTKQRARRTLKQMKAQNEILGRATAHPQDIERAMLSVLDFDPSGKVSGPNVSIQAQVIRGRAQAIMTDFIEQFRSKSAGFRRRKAGMRAIVRELFGEASGDVEAKSLAGGIRSGMEYLRVTFNAAGGDIPARSDWGLPQTHNRRAVAAASKQDWIDFTLGHLDREKMLDHETGLSFTDTKLRRVLADAYDSIASNGMSELRPGGVQRAGLVNRRQQSRFLTFKNADAWFDYQEKFGEGDTFSLVMGHIEGMSRDTALIQVMGPSPEATLRFMENIIDQSRAKVAIEGTGNKAARAAGRIGTALGDLRDTFSVLNGTTGRVGGNVTFANASAANRNVLTSAMLGGAFLSAFSDLGFSNVAARFAGIPAAKVLLRHLKLFLPGNLADQKLAVRLGFGAQSWSSTAIAAQRYVGELIGPEWSQAIADSVLRLSLLSPWTQAGRHGFMMEFAGHLTDQISLPFSGLSGPLQRTFERHGITAADWDLMRVTPLWRDAETVAEFLRPQDLVARLDATQADTPLFARNMEVANKFQAMVLTEAEFAIPSVTARSRAILLGGSQPGTFWGEIRRNLSLFKGFPVTVLHLQAQRAAGMKGGVARKGAYAMDIAIATTLMGALAVQLKEIAAGRDPIQMDGDIGRKFWGKAFLQGGGAGIVGDLLFSDVNRYGVGILGTLAGPVLGTQLDALSKLTVGNAQELVRDGEAKGVGRELSRFAKLMLPGRSLWYSRLALERMLLDELDRLADPNAAGAFRRIEQRARKETGQRFWSRPGRGLRPQRGPALSGK